eukprot:3536547-Karenia_brevis.AAC.1
MMKDGSLPTSFKLAFAVSAILSKSTGNMKLHMLGSTPPAHKSSSSGAAHFHCHPLSNFEIAALKLIILGGRP